MLMVDDNVGNKFRHNAVQNVGHLVGRNAVQNQGIQNVRNQIGLSVVSEITNQHGNGNVVAARAEVKPGTADSCLNFKNRCQIATKGRSRIPLIQRDNLQQASTSGTQTDKAPVYDSDESVELINRHATKDRTVLQAQFGDLKGKSKDTSCVSNTLDPLSQKLENENVELEFQYTDLQTELDQCKHDKILYDKSYNDMQQKIERLQAQLGDLKGKISDTQCASNTLDLVSQKLKDENVSLESQVLNYAKENAHLKTTYKNLFDSIKVTQAQTNSIIDSLQKQLYDTIYENAKLRA
ncbi:hypothetical protein Tco_0438128 [Tanacetum coccineum]